MIESTSKCRFSLVFFSYSDAMKNVFNVQFDEYFCLEQSVQIFIDERQWISIFDDYFVYFFIIYAQTKFFICLLDEENECFRERHELNNEVFFHVFIYVIFQDFQFCRWQIINEIEKRISIRQNLDNVIMKIMLEEFMRFCFKEDILKREILKRNLLRDVTIHNTEDCESRVLMIEESQR
jgi:hypothetical protein